MSVFDEVEALSDTIVNGIVNILTEFTTNIELEYSLLTTTLENDIQQYKNTGVLTSTLENLQSEHSQIVKHASNEGVDAVSKRKSSLKENVANYNNSQRPTERNLCQHDNVLSNKNIDADKNISALTSVVQIKIEKLTNLFDNVKEKEAPVLPNVYDVLSKKIKLEALNSSYIELSQGVLQSTVQEDLLEVSDGMRVTRARTKGRIKNNQQNVNVNEKIKKERFITKINIDNDNNGKDSGSSSSSVQKKNLTNGNSLSSEAEETGTQQLSSTNKPIGVTKPIRKNKPLISKDTLATGVTKDKGSLSKSPQKNCAQRKETQFFSPYDKTPVKKIVQVYEQLAGTRSKTKLPTKSVTKTSTSRIPQLCSTPLNASSSRPMRTLSAFKASSESRSASALKASQREFEERERRRKQKEHEAIRKKESLMRAQSEARRLRREERALKVKQAQMMMEKEKQKHLQLAEKARDEKFKQMLAEKESKFLKQKEEAARKRAAANNKIAQHDQKPAYLTHPMPLLPTPDCYDSDDESKTRATFLVPLFMKKEHLKKTLFQMHRLQSHKLALFPITPQSPNLKDIFPGIQSSKLKRTSSAIWNKTEMSILESMIED